ncbi:F-box domain-containing protein [Artemisia annua]|uniref:F-box domain-containing protein n=1 Tax=Artemisia annua TaxID=35608 RepID=A0A2U1KW93_ARTAN|nr:F-box domain-containing protein [Artemisia annua]
MSDEPPLLPEILSRLPVKTLLRCRSVSKDWRELIDSPDFVKIHLNQSKGTYKVLTFLRQHHYSIISSHSLSLNSRPTFVKVEPPFNLTGFFPRDLGSCNGLICLSWGESNQELSLWNPSTQKHKFIPTMPIHYPPHTEDNLIVDTLGYDNANDDYKVVRLLQFSASERGSFDYKILVYSLKLNVWQNVEQDFAYCFDRVCCNAPLSHSVCVHGAIHWSLIRKDVQDLNLVIVAFDLASHSFRLVPQPDYPPLYYILIDVGLLGGCLCMVGIPEHNTDYVDIWVMEKYGVKESWRKLLSISDMRYMPCVRPLVSLNNGKVVLLEANHGEFFLYDIEKKKSKEISIRKPCTGLPFGLYTYSSYIYQESLV